MPQLKEILPKELIEKQKNNIVMLDVRRDDEWMSTGIIENSICLTFFDMFGNHDVISWLQEFNKHVTTKEQEFILICAHANRTKVIGDYLIDQGYLNVGHLTGGIARWKQEGEKTINI